MKRKVVSLLLCLLLLLNVSLLSSCSDGVQGNSDLAGMCLEFGNYYVSVEREEHKKPLKWQVFEVDEDKVYLITENVIDCLPYSANEDVFTWTDSEIRNWLNDYFYNTAFSDEEKEHIISEDLEVLNHSRYEANREAEKTTDKVFLMTAEQAQELSRAERRCFATEYAKRKGLFTEPDGSYAMWWLMSPGYYKTAACCVDIYGNIQNCDAATAERDVLTSFTANYCGVRPMIALERSTAEALLK